MSIFLHYKNKAGFEKPGIIPLCLAPSSFVTGKLTFVPSRTPLSRLLKPSS